MSNIRSTEKIRAALIPVIVLVIVCLASLVAVREVTTLAAPYEYPPQANPTQHSPAANEASTPTPAVDISTPVAAPADAHTPGPLATMQARLAGGESHSEKLFCFAETGSLIVPIDHPAPGLAVVQLSVMFNGSYSFLGLQSGQYLLFAAGGGSSDGVFETTPFGISDLSPLLPPYLVTLTDSSISFGSDSKLPLVSCADVESQVHIMKTKIEQAEAEGRFEIPQAEIPDEGPLTALQASLDGQRLESDAYCFTAEGVQILPSENLAPDRSSLRLAIDADGVVSFLGTHNHGFVIYGEGQGNAAGRFTVDVTGSTISNAQRAAEIALTDDSITLGDATLGLVPCAEIATLIETASARLDNDAGFDAHPTEVELARVPGNEVLSSDGLGSIRIGMRVSELETHLGFEVGFDSIDGHLSDAGACGWVNSIIDPDVGILVEVTGDGDAIVRRLITPSNRWATPSGIRVGMTEQQVIDTFPNQLDIRPHVFVDDGQYLTFIPSDANDPNTVEFVIEFGVVAEIRVGAQGWVSRVEGCL